jgi:hypothetical protein
MLTVMTDRKPPILDFVKDAAGVWSDPWRPPRPPPWPPWSLFSQPVILRPASLVSMISST